MNITPEKAKRIGDKLGADWGKITPETLIKGAKVEFEHKDIFPDKGETPRNWVMALKIANAHLKERPDYYDKLAKMEKEPVTEAVNMTLKFAFRTKLIDAVDKLVRRFGGKLDKDPVDTGGFMGAYGGDENDKEVFWVKFPNKEAKAKFIKAVRKALKGKVSVGSADEDMDESTKLTESTKDELFALIKPRSRVTIVNRFGQKLTGRAVMFNRQYGTWVLNMGGQYGKPAIASPENVVAVDGKKL